MTITRGYVTVVAVLAAIGVVAQTPWPLLFAALLTLPVGGAAVVLYYLAYGLLSAVTHANPSLSIGYSAGRPDGTTTTAWATAPTPMWFTVVTGVLTVAMFTGAAIANAALIRQIGRSRAATP